VHPGDPVPVDLGLLPVLRPEMMVEDQRGSVEAAIHFATSAGSRTKGPLMTALVLLAALASAWADPPQTPSNAPGPSAYDIVASIETVVADAIARAEPSVVAIHRAKTDNSQETLAVRGRRRPPNPDELRGRFPGRFMNPAEYPDFLSTDYGSGVVIGDRGEILTLYHVVRGARQLIVRAADHQSFDAEIIAADPRSDLAVIVPTENEGVDAPHLKPLPIGDAGRLRKGAFLIALGNPFNAARDGKPSASWGILSNLARRLEADWDDTFGSRRMPMLPNYPILLQLDSKLNLGMSGGAVINFKGELVGLTTMASSPAGFDFQAGYAIPLDKLSRRAVDALKEGREVEYGLLGIIADPRNSNRVGNVQKDSPADRGQLQVNDEIIDVNGVPVTDFDSLILAINSYSAGDTVRLKVRRFNEVIERTIVLAKFPVDGGVIATKRPKPWRGLRVDYTSVEPYRIRGPNSRGASAAGVMVIEVEEGSAAALAGIKKGQIILGVGDQSVNTPPEFAKAVAEIDGPVTLQTDLGPRTIK
jgi:serine protease Do